jgi:hypothetical protein
MAPVDELRCEQECTGESELSEVLYGLYGPPETGPTGMWSHLAIRGKEDRLERQEGHTGADRALAPGGADPLVVAAGFRAETTGFGQLADLYSSPPKPSTLVEGLPSVQEVRHADHRPTH